MVKFLFFWSELRSTFWFVPILIIIISIGLATGFLYLDTHYQYTPEGIIKYIFTGSVDSARSVLATISGAMIGVAGTVFSITLVALTLASSQFGSRLLRNFMHESTNQIVLGTYVATYVYCLIVLNSIRELDSATFIPSYSVLFAIVAALGNIILLIIFIHHIAISIQANNVISDIYKALYSSVNQLFPEELSEDNQNSIDLDIDKVKSNYNDSLSITVKNSGYLQHIDHDRLFKIAQNHDLFIEAFQRAGDYLVEGILLYKIYTNTELDEDALKSIHNSYITGNTRTPQQDAEFYVLQMEEIALRALSPGINDPHTAIACIDNLTSTMAYLTKVKFPSPYRHDEDDTLRLYTTVLTYEGMMDAAFNQIRQHSSGSPSVIIRLMDALTALKTFATTDEHNETIMKHAKMILRTGEHALNEENDLKDLKAHSKDLLSEGS